MSSRTPRSRPRPRSLRSGALFVLATIATTPFAAAAALPSSAAAQIPDTVRPVPKDTLRRPIPVRGPDTLARPILQDTLSRGAAQDTIDADTLGPPPPQLPRMPPVGDTGWAAGVWQWDRADLMRLPDLSLLQLLERIPGLTPVRTHFLGQAEAAAVFGATAGAFTYVVDGFELDPLGAPTLDPSRLPLLALAEVRVERRVTGATVRIRTLSPDDPRDQSIIEAGTGDFDTNLFRGMLLVPSVLGGPLGLGFERLSTDGFRSGRFNHLAGWLKYTFVHDSSGIQLEYRQSTMDRTPITRTGGLLGLPGLFGERRDWVVRARTRRWGVTAEAYTGGSSIEDEVGDVVVREGTAQGGVRIGATPRLIVPLETRAALRLRSDPRLPQQEFEAEVEALPLPWVRISGELRRGWWDDGFSDGYMAARTHVGPLFGLSAFGEISTGQDPVRLDLRGLAFRDSARTASDLQGVRAGAELRWGGVVAGAAHIRTAVDSVAGFGLVFDPTAPRFEGGTAAGYEATLRVPTGFDPIWLEGWYVGMDAADTWLYLPDHHWRAALVYHHWPLPSRNLEIYLRAEHEFRGRMTIPSFATATGPPTAIDIASTRATNLELTIRVLTVRAFLRWQNIFNRTNQTDLPGWELPRQHVAYGVKWIFWN